LEETIKAFIQTSNQNIQGLNQNIEELKNATMSNSQNLQELKQFTHHAFVKMEGQIDYLVAELNKIEEEELQGQLMAQGHYMIDEQNASHSCHEHVLDTTIVKSEEIVDDNKEKIEPPADTSLSNDKEVSTETHSFIIVHLETHHESKASILLYLKEPSYAKILKDLCRQGHKSRNHRPKKIFPNKQVGYLRWRNIIPECYQILKKK
jgi:hypothetical protein